MPVGAIIGGVASIGGALLGSSAQKSAANKAADASLQVAQQNNALARDIYGQNQQSLSPFMQRGNAAGSAINALLGLDEAANVNTASSPNAAPATPSTFIPPVGSAVNGGGRFDALGNVGRINEDPAIMARMQSAQAPPVAAAPPMQAVPAGQSPQQAAQSAFDIFKNSTGYQTRLNEGFNALNTGYAARGLLQSGAALKALNRFGQDFASNEFGNYLGYLSNQQGVGLSGASALAGVGQNYVNNVSANNNSAGTAAANAALMKGQANANMFGSIAGSLGGMFGSSYGR